MSVTVDAKEVGGRFAELAALVASGVEVMIHDGDVVLQLVPPVPPLTPPREHTFEVYSNGTTVRDDFNEPMELVDSYIVREWEALAAWVHALRKSETASSATHTQPPGDV